MKRSIWLVSHRQINTGFFINDAFIMGKGIKSGFAMIRAHATFSEAAKAHFCCGKMDNGIVDTATTETSMGNDFICSLFA